MAFENIYLVTNKRAVASDVEVTDLEQKIGFRLPVGYREYVTQLGKGRYSDVLSVYMPDQVLGDLEQRRASHSEYFGEFFLQWRDQPLSQADIDRCVELADTIEGDSVIACPGFPGKAFLLPRHHDLVVVAETGFIKPERLCFDGTWTPEFEFFESSHPDRTTFRRYFAYPASMDDMAGLLAQAFSSGHVRREKDHLFLQSLNAIIQLLHDPILNQRELFARIDNDRVPLLEKFLAERAG